MSVHAALEAALPPGSLAPRRFDRSVFADFHDFELLLKEARNLVVIDRHETQALGQFRVVSGHFSLPTLLQITSASSISTVLREPRTRLLSLYVYCRVPGINEFWTPNHTAEQARRPLGEFLSEPRIAAVVDNQICRMLLYGDERLPESSFAAESDIESIAADAIERLNALGFVGVLELGHMWQGLARLFNVTLDPTKLNVTEDLGCPAAADPRERLVTSDALHLIEQRNAADLLVYDHALACAGLSARERQRLGDGVFARQLVKLGDLIGGSASRVAEQASEVEMLHRQVVEQKQSQAKLHVRLLAHERTIQSLRQEICRRDQELNSRDQELNRLRGWLDAVHASGSWRLTTPLRAAKRGVHALQDRHQSAIPPRERSLLTGWSVSQVWWLALSLNFTVTVTDVILKHVILIPLLAVGPFCGVLTGRWVKAATIGVWAVVLSVLLGLPDKIWDTYTQLANVGVVAAVALLTILAAILIQSRRGQLR